MGFRWFDSVDETERGKPRLNVALVLIVLVAFEIRLAAAELITSFIDEHVSMLAATAVAEQGIPFLPSGRLYLQGATLSYLVAPLIALGFDSLGDLTLLRFPSVLAGALSVLAAWFLGRTVTRSNAGGLLIALFLALDPMSVRWSAYLRMYALLQLCVVVLAWLYIRLLMRPDSQRRPLELAIVGTFWIAGFTHLAVLLVWPAMAMAAVAIEGRSLLNRRIDLPITLGACLAGPAALFLANRLAGQPDQPMSTSTAGSSFVGDHLLSLQSILSPSLEAWLELFAYGPLSLIPPVIIAAASAFLIVTHLLGTPGTPDAELWRRASIAVLILYWAPIALVALFSESQQGRYLHHVHPLGYAIVGMMIVNLVTGVVPRPGRLRLPRLTTWFDAPVGDAPSRAPALSPVRVPAGADFVASDHLVSRDGELPSGPRQQPAGISPDLRAPSHPDRVILPQDPDPLPGQDEGP